MEGHLECVRLLIGEGANVNIKNVCDLLKA